MYRKIILDKLDKITEIPSSISVSAEIERLTNDPNSSVEQIGNLLRVDPALTAKVLKLANSAVFAHTQRIVSINQAITQLGFAEFRKLTGAITYLNTFRPKHLNYQKYWLHTLTVAFLAVRLNEICKASINPDRLFTGGILHDIGIMILDSYYSDIYKKVFEISTNKRIDLSVVEESVLGINHAEVGAIMMTKWRLPEQFVDIILHHHKPQYSQVVQTDTKLIYIANFIANNRGVDNGSATFAEYFYDDIWEELNLTVDDIPDIIASVHDETEKAKQLLKLGGN
jgi:putative nucleotidyltransferase with HDIG domain